MLLGVLRHVPDAVAIVGSADWHWQTAKAMSGTHPLPLSPLKIEFSDSKLGADGEMAKAKAKAGRHPVR